MRRLGSLVFAGIFGLGGAVLASQDQGYDFSGLFGEKRQEPVQKEIDLPKSIWSGPSPSVYTSDMSFDETVAQLRDAIKDRKLGIFIEVDHQAGAEKAGLDLGRAHLILFGNPRVGTLLMQQNIEIGLDLPMKALVFEQAGEVKLKMTDIVALASAHDIPSDRPPVSKVASVLKAIATTATSD